MKAGLRACALGGLALTGTVLGLRTASHDAGSSGCALELPCRRCRLLAGCSEPRATRIKEEDETAVGKPAPPERKETQ